MTTASSGLTTAADRLQALRLARLELRAHPEDHPEIRAFAAKLQEKRERKAGLVRRKSLIEQARHAWQTGKLPVDFTPAQFKDWILRTGITRPDGAAYAESSVNALLSNSDIANTGSTNRNKKVLKSFDKNGKKHFTFI